MPVGEILDSLGQSRLKLCKRCGNAKALTDFYKTKNTKDHLETSCKLCRRAGVYKWRKTPNGKTYRVRSEQNRRKRNPERLKRYLQEYESRPETIQKRADYKRRPEVQERNRLRTLHRRCKRVYNTTLEAMYELIEKQERKCAVCLQPLIPAVIGKHCVIDHDHVTGLVRGVVHNRCNMIVGVVETSPDIVEAAKRYVRNEHNLHS